MVEKAYTVVFLDSAYKDLASIKNYWEQFLETSADNLMFELYSKAKNLEEFPLAHHLSKDPKLQAEGSRIIPIRNYYMFFNFVNRKLFQQLRIYKTFAQANT